jgi:DNA-binding XRE family transcriptional regulator
MKGICNFADQRAGDFLTTEHAKEVYMVDIQNVRQLTEAYTSSFTSLFYNIPYEVRTHAYKYIPRWNICQREVGGEIFHSGIRIKRMKGKEIGQRIRLLRKVLNLTQAEFGEKIGRAWNTINRWEAGERNSRHGFKTHLLHLRRLLRMAKNRAGGDVGEGRESIIRRA